MTSYTYVDTPNPNLVCCICRTPFLDPCTTRTCCHTFCYECIARAIAISRQCPIDRCPLSLLDLGPADPLIRNLVDEMVVECPQRPAGCTYTCQRLLLPAHISDSCEYVEVACSHKGCGKQVLRRDFTRHRHNDESKDEEPAASGHGLEANHEQEATGSTSPSSTSNSVQLEDPLRVENALLKHRISALEGVVNILRHEMQAVKHALGPWYSEDDAGFNSVAPGSGISRDGEYGHRGDSQVTSPSRSALPEPSSQSPVQPSRLSHSRAASATEGTETVDLASYFPPAEDEDVYSPDFLRSATQHPAAGHPHRSHAPQVHLAGPNAAAPAAYVPPTPYNVTARPVPPYTSPGLAPNLALAVPPLDPSQPLPATLADLHGMLVSLAGALGALGSARAQDALHTNEELRSVRAGMHGLRMQVHDIMTTRSAGSAQPSASVGANGSASIMEGAGVGATGMGGGPSWLAYGPRIIGPPHFPHLPVSTTKL